MPIVVVSPGSAPTIRPMKPGGNQKDELPRLRVFRTSTMICLPALTAASSNYGRGIMARTPNTYQTTVR
jgi:hypothetical protein